MLAAKGRGTYPVNPLFHGLWNNVPRCSTRFVKERASANLAESLVKHDRVVEHPGVCTGTRLPGVGGVIYITEPIFIRIFILTLTSLLLCPTS